MLEIGKTAKDNYLGNLFPHQGLVLIRRNRSTLPISAKAANALSGSCQILVSILYHSSIEHAAVFDEQSATSNQTFLWSNTISADSSSPVCMTGCWMPALVPVAQRIEQEIPNFEAADSNSAGDTIS